MKLFNKKDDIIFEKEQLTEKLKKSDEARQFFLRTIGGLLLFIKDFSLEAKEIRYYKFREEIDFLAEKFKSNEKINKINPLFEKYTKIVPKFIKQQKNYIKEKEKELKDIIDILTKAMASLNTENKTFYHRIHAQSEKIEQITRLDDIKKIKTVLKREVEYMQNIVSEKESLDTAQITILSNKVDSLKVELEKAKKKSLMDGLTGVHNRQAFDEYIKEIAGLNLVTKSPFSILMLDLDDFKNINDKFGHITGDRVLLSFANKCKDITRKEDFFARYGGEEFVAVLPGASLRNGTKKAKQICKSIASSQYAVEEDQKDNFLSFTVSIGVSSFNNKDDVTSVIERADKALYLAKRTGKNCVVTEKDLKKSISAV